MSTKTKQTTKPAINAKSTVANAKVVNTKIVKHDQVSKLNETKPKFTPPTHDFLAVNISMPPKIDASGKELPYKFGEVIQFYKEQALEQFCINLDVMDHIKSQKYVINPQTGTRFNRHVLRYTFVPNPNNTIDFGDKSINITRFLTQKDFAKDVIEYYKNHGFTCTIYRTGYDEENDRYRFACIELGF